MVDTKSEEEVLVNPLDNLLDDNNQETPETTTPDNSHQEKKQEEKPTEWADNDKADDEKAKEEAAKAERIAAKEKRHAEQQEWAKAEVEKARALVVELAYEKAQTDARVLLELGKKDPIAADMVAKKFWYENFKEAKEQIHAELGIAKAEPMSDEEKEAYYQERRTKEIHEEAITEAKAKFDDLPDDVKKQALEEFDDLAEGKTLTKAKALKIADMISLSLSKGEKTKDAYKQGVKQLSSVTIAKTSVADKDEWQEVVIDGKLVTLSSKKTQ